MDGDMGKDRSKRHRPGQDLEKDLAVVIERLSADQLEKLTIQSILEQNRLLDLAEDAYGVLKTAEEKSSSSVAELREGYALALLGSKAQVKVVAMLVDRLGYIPDLPDTSNSLQ